MSDTSEKWSPVITDACAGCGKCIQACPYDCLELVWDFATLSRAEDCVSEGDCVDICPEDAIRMVWQGLQGNESVGRWRVAGAAPATPRTLLGRLRQLVLGDPGRADDAAIPSNGHVPAADYSAARCSAPQLGAPLSRESS